MTADFSWINCYTALASKLWEYKDQQKELISIIKNGVFTDAEQENFQKAIACEKIDPFSVFACFNCLSKNKRIEYVKKLSVALGLSLEAPTDFSGVPNAQPLQKRYHDGYGNTVSQDIDVLWALFDRALRYAQELNNEAYKNAFESAFDEALKINGIAIPKLTAALFWFRPNVFVSLDSKTCSFLQNLNPDIVPNNLNEINGKSYVGIIGKIAVSCSQEDMPFHSIPELSYVSYVSESHALRIWKISHGALSAAERNKLQERKAISINKHTKILGGSKKAQGEIFETEVKKGDYFYLCYGSTVKLLGRVNVDKPSPNPDKTDWLEYSYDIVAEALKDTPYADEKAWWTPNWNSTFVSINPNQNKSFEKRILSPYFGLTLADLANEAFDQDFDMIDFKGENETMISETDIALNTILYGPPGTGKTYHTAIYAVAICDGMTEKEAKARDYKTEILPRYEELIAEKRIVFTTFHQSYGYEDFMEGIKPKATDGSVVYQIESGVFKRFCQDWLNDAWCCLVEDAKKNGNKVSVPWLNTADELCLEYKQTQDGEQAFYDSFNKDENSRYHNATKSKLCKWLDNVAKGLDENTSFPANRRPLNLCKAVYEKLKSEYSPEKLKERSLPPKVFIIDEINRGNISKIFGELITLIEDDKRGSACVTLPYSGESFTVPKNVYVLGTMNTADRSIALMDTALRRRFTFTEMMPVPSLLSDDADGVSVRKLLTAINDRIEYLYDREHTVGHAYFKEFIGGNGGIAALRKIFKDKLLPLLQEYFYDDYEKIALVLADGLADEGERFIKERKKAFEALGGGYGEEKKYDVNNDVWKLSDDAFKARLLKIYHDLPDEADA